MYVFFYVIIILNVERIVIHVKANEEDALVANVAQQIQQLDPYQITIFCNSSARQSVKEDRILRRILPMRPSVLVDLSKAAPLNSSTSSLSRMAAFGYPRWTNFYLVLLTRRFYTENIHLRQLQVLLDLLVNLSPRTMRPKTLLVYLEADSISRSWLDPMLRYAWFKKFLDISVILPKADRKADIFHYNPFTQSRNNEEFTGATRLFPDKLSDMQGFVIKVPFLDIPPYMMAKRVNQSLVYTGSGISGVRFFGRVLNFTVNVIDNQRAPIITRMELDSNRKRWFISFVYFSNCALRNVYYYYTS